MPRMKRSVKAKRRHKKVLKQTKGYRGGRSRLFRTAKETLERALNYAYRDRRNRKRDFRRLWIVRLNAAARQNGLTYGALMNGLRLANVAIDRKMLSELSIREPRVFSEIASLAKSTLK